MLPPSLWHSQPIFFEILEPKGAFCAHRAPIERFGGRRIVQNAPADPRQAALRFQGLALWLSAGAIDKDYLGACSNHFSDTRQTEVIVAACQYVLAVGAPNFSE